MNTSANIRFATLAAVAAATLFLQPSGAFAWSLFSSEESRMWKASGTAMEQAEAAEREGRVMDEIDALSEAGRTLAELAEKFPDYKPEEVLSRRSEVSARTRALMAAVRNGEIAVPEPDAAWRGKDAASVETPADRGSADDGPITRFGIPDLVRVESAVADAAKPAPPEPEPEAAPPPVPESREEMDADTRRIRSTIPNPFFAEGGVEALFGSRPAPAPAPDPAPVSEPAPVREVASATAADPLPATPPLPAVEPVAPAASVPAPVPAAGAPAVSVSVRESVMPAVGPDDPDVQLRAVAEMIKTARAPDAVILLEDILERDGPSAPLKARLLLARALLECRNYPRAKETLDAIPAFADSDPSVRTLRAAACLASGRPQEALLQLDQLISEHPDWSDAYVDCAYVMFLIDPKGNREDAIAYYRNGLSFGARRDARLERQLGIRVGE